MFLAAVLLAATGGGKASLFGRVRVDAAPPPAGTSVLAQAEDGPWTAGPLRGGAALEPLVRGQVAAGGGFRLAVAAGFLYRVWAEAPNAGLVSAVRRRQGGGRPLFLELVPASILELPASPRARRYAVLAADRESGEAFVRAAGLLPPGRGKTLLLSPGRYEVCLVAAGGEAARARIVLGPGRRLALPARAARLLGLPSGLARGRGLFGLAALHRLGRLAQGLLELLARFDPRTACGRGSLAPGARILRARARIAAVTTPRHAHSLSVTSCER